MKNKKSEANEDLNIRNELTEYGNDSSSTVKPTGGKRIPISYENGENIHHKSSNTITFLRSEMG